jgi:hypothetical protein
MIGARGGGAMRKDGIAGLFPGDTDGRSRRRNADDIKHRAGGLGHYARGKLDSGEGVEQARPWRKRGVVEKWRRERQECRRLLQARAQSSMQGAR